MRSLLIASYSHTQHNLSTQWTDYNFEQTLFNKQLSTLYGEKAGLLFKLVTSVRCQLLATAEKNMWITTVRYEEMQIY